MLDGRFYVYLIASLLVSLALAMVSMWQIEEIWRSLQNGWVYGLPFGHATSDYWFAHDIWFTLWAFSYGMLLILVLGLTMMVTKLERMVK